MRNHGLRPVGGKFIDIGENKVIHVTREFILLLNRFWNRKGNVRKPLNCHRSIMIVVFSFAAALVHKFEDCLGIEILSSLYEISVDRQTAWTSLVSATEALAHLQHTRVQFTHGDATVIDWMDADVLFVNGTCFEVELFNALEAKAVDLKPGTFIITTTRQ